jgi:hypothetical protein
MTRVLLLGLDPETVDFSDPALPPGMTAEKVHAGIAVAQKQFAERGWEGDVGLIRPDKTAGPAVERLLASARAPQVSTSQPLYFDPTHRVKIHAAFGTPYGQANPGFDVDHC